MKTKRRTLLRWMGGKSRSAEFIISHLPTHTTYVEPFCGGCAVLFRKPRSKCEVINDRDNRLINLLRVFRYHPDELLREAEFITHSRREFLDALAQPGITDIQRAARFLAVVHMSFGGRLRSPTFGYSRTGTAHLTSATIRSLVAAARERLDGVTIENLDFAEVVARYDAPGTLFYCDPPYIDTAGYMEPFTDADHLRLHDTLTACRGRAAVSLNDCEKARTLYNGWIVHEWLVGYSVGRINNRERTNAEILMIKP